MASTQYTSEREWPWWYESYCRFGGGGLYPLQDSGDGDARGAIRAWATQPCLIVKDLKLGEVAGAVALWIGPGTEGYFTNLKITPLP